MTAAALVPSLLTNILAGKGVIRSDDGVIWAGERVIKSRTGFLMPFHPITIFEIQKYYQNEPRFNGVY